MRTITLGLDLSCADQHAIGLHIMGMFMQARRLPTREERIAFMSGQVLCGPHRGSVRFSHENAKYAADLIDAEEQAKAATALAEGSGEGGDES